MKSDCSSKITVGEFKAWLEGKDDDAVVMLRTAPIEYRNLRTDELALMWEPT